MSKITRTDIQDALVALGPATKEEVAAHLGTRFQGIAMAFREAARDGLIVKHQNDLARGITTWVAA